MGTAVEPDSTMFTQPGLATVHPTMLHSPIAVEDESQKQLGEEESTDEDENIEVPAGQPGTPPGTPPTTPPVAALGSPGPGDWSAGLGEQLAKEHSTVQKLLPRVAQNKHEMIPHDIPAALKLAEAELLRVFEEVTKNSGASPAENPQQDDQPINKIAGVPDKELEFWRRMKDNDFNFICKGAAGARWTRALASDPQLEAEYDECTGKRAKQVFRQNWAKKKHAEVEQRCTHSEEVSHTDRSEGRWRTLAAVASRQGGGDVLLGLEKATNICADCIRRGPDFVRINKRSKGLEFIDVEDMRAEEQKQSWGIETIGANTLAPKVKKEDGRDDEGKGTVKTEDKGASGSANNNKKRGGEKKEDGRDDEGKRTVKTDGGRPKKKARGASGSASASGSGTGKASVDPKMQLAQARKSKLLHAAVMQSMGMLRHTISTDDSWAFMRIDQMVKPLSDAEEALTSYIDQNPFVHAAIGSREDIAKLKESFGGGQYETGLHSMVTEFTVKTKLLEAQVNSAIAQHKARQEAEELEETMRQQSLLT